MAPLVEKLRKNLGVAVEQYEVWRNEDNLKKFREYDKSFCGGAPFLLTPIRENLFAARQHMKASKNGRKAWPCLKTTRRQKI
jgi:hypothetical protein